MQIIKGVVGGMLLFLGRELNWLFGGGFAALTAFLIVPLLPDTWPQWAQYAFIGGLGVLVAGITIVYERVGYYVSGFFFGGYFLVIYFIPKVTTLPFLFFSIGGVIGALIIGLFGEWSLMFTTCIVGAIFVADLFPVSFELKTLIGAGLFVFGALVQVIIMRAEKQSSR